jgi:Fic family protein
MGDTDFLIAEMFAWLKNCKLESVNSIVETAISAHLKIVKIHPFTDGNGRSARLFMNTILMQNSLPPIDILPESRKDYLQSLENSDEQSPSEFTDFILYTYDQNLDIYLKTFE